MAFNTVTLIFVMLSELFLILGKINIGKFILMIPMIMLLCKEEIDD